MSPAPTGAGLRWPEEHGDLEQRTVAGLSFGLTHPCPQPFTGVRVFVFAQATDSGERW